ncbi:LysM peptidoglycan-binding domain-containing protein [Ruminococcus sp. CLA-AA-H200]|uniref:LysM peptidoglycan-binding domain-containing protein n=1 Tax=Ruminococcus turbiniformis TaxID=2881258 RepID=A0ABS8G282_9FIRM|nr:glycosyl hydrolase family 18 protein [Ruminococcus turbiniformis]MCC2255044.1 LysM peptidoglycan-binding domain-containing protein [Ruminococcus turbiniformis]
MIYVVAKGDTLEDISRRTGVPVEKIVYDNQIENRDRLVEGQALLLLGEGERPDYRGGLSVGGYAYPFVEQSVLEEAFPALNELLIFSYGFTFEGNLVPPRPDELWMIEAAWQQGIEPLLVLTPFSDGAFNNQLIKVLVENEQVQENLIGQLYETVRDRGYAGVDIDFEYVLPEDRVLYAEFVGKVRDRLGEYGYRVSVAVAPKTSDGQRGILVEGIDYAMLGENADKIFLMTYEWGYTYGPPMAVSPLDKVRQVIEYALEKLPAEKLIMGIPNYGYDWPRPYVRGVTRARTIGNVEAVNLASEMGAVIQYAPIAQAPWFTYSAQGTAHEVWFEDPRSIEAKLNLAREYDLSGVGYWNLMRPFQANWIMLNEKSPG